MSACGCNPGSDASTRPSTRKTTPGKSPNTTHSAARSACGTSITAGASCAPAAARLRGNARKLIPNAFTKHAAAKAVVSAKSAPPTGNRKCTSGSAEPRKPYKNAWNVSHSLANPFRGGRPEIAIAPMRKNSPVHGIRRSRPPNCSICRVPVVITTSPAAEKQQPLEDRMIQHVVQARRDADPGELAATVRQRHHARAKTQQDDSKDLT